MAETSSNAPIGIIAGSGLGDALEKIIKDPQFKTIDTPFGKPSTDIMTGYIANRKIAFINRHGRGHKLAPSEIPFAANIFALKKVGVTTLISTGAVGSLKEEFAPSDLVIVDQFIDKTFKRQTSFFEGIAAAHCEMAQPSCSRLGKAILTAAGSLDITTHPKGCYVCMEGPQFSTRAESLMHRSWGGDLIGMTAMPEAKLAREAQLCYALIALPSDYDCWRPHEENKDKQTLLKEIISNLQKAAENCIKLIEAVLQSDQQLCCDDCYCRKSLELAVWTDKGAISDAEMKKLDILFK